MMTRGLHHTMRARFLAALVACSVLVIVGGGSRVLADRSLSLTVTPPLYQLTIGPGEIWSSALKVVNNNDYDVTYYAQVVDMEANGETGQSKFIPLLGKPDPALVSSQLAQWVKLEPGPYTIKAGTSANVHFSVQIPSSAEPGGHYAAILVGTQPLSASSTGSQMLISSYVSSLMFVRIKGDVIESARIREFTSDKSLYQLPQADFVLRFENTGNTHLKPEGDITIYNMWGKERGKVEINQKTDFGNVLPKTIRRFEFSWEGEANVFDIGRYSAVVTLGYGQDSQKNIVATTYFWVVPLVPVAWTIAVVGLILFILGWFIRRYIRRALELERARYGYAPQEPPPQLPFIETIVEPLKEGVVDLRSVTRKVQTNTFDAVEARHGQTISTVEFMRKYKLFFAFVALVLALISILSLYLGKVLVPERTYNIKSVESHAEEAQN